MYDKQDMIRILADTVEGGIDLSENLSMQDLIEVIACCVEVDENNDVYLKTKESDKKPYIRTKPLDKEVYQMIERQIWNDHGNIWAQNITKDDRVPDEWSHYSDYLSLPLTENKSGVIYDYLIRYDDNVLYYDPSNSGKNVDSECRIFKDLAEFIESDATYGAIYLKVSIFDEPGFLAKWYVTKDHWVALETEKYDVLRTYKKL